MKTVLASVSDKTGLVEFIKVLETFDQVEVYATGSTAKHLEEAGITCQTVESLTGFPEILEGRVKTLHPKIFGGILAKDTVLHQSHLQAHQIPRFDIVIVNLYPFESVARSSQSEEEIIENIDIGGVALIRAAAKNYRHTLVIPSREFYPTIIHELHETQGILSVQFRRTLARKTFELTAYYDSLISAYMLKAENQDFSNEMSIQLTKIEDLRYGENPHQKAAWYHQANAEFIKPFEQLQGKQMSANNLVDTVSAFKILQEFPQDPACCIIKHNNPCGVAIGNTIEEAYHKAYEADPVSAFGGIFGFNRTLTKEIAENIANMFVEIVMAPDFDSEALAVLEAKKNVRVLKLPKLAEPKAQGASWIMKDLESFGILLQETTLSPELPELTTVTAQPMLSEIRSDVALAWAIVKHLTSNAIVVVKNGQTVGFGIGQTSRIASVEIALRQAGEKAKDAVMASDGFFPASDNIEAAAKSGIAVIIQPGGSIKDPEVIEAADQHGLVMVLTNERCFKH